MSEVIQVSTNSATRGNNGTLLMIYLTQIIQSLILQFRNIFHLNYLSNKYKNASLVGLYFNDFDNLVILLDPFIWTFSSVSLDTIYQYSIKNTAINK